jgi:hypothetical protein
MRTALIIIGLAVVLAVLGTMFRGKLFPSDEPRVEAPAPATQTQAEPASSVESQAEAFIAKLTEPQSKPVPAKSADHFMLKDQIISLLPESTIELTTPRGIESNPALKPDTPITVIREVEQVETTTPEKIIAEAGGDLDETITILDGDQTRDLTVREVLQRYAANPDDPISVVKKIQYFEITTPAEIARDSTLSPDQELKIITKPYRLEAATIAELLMREGKFNPDSIFYVRTIRDTDKQGIWGIINDGIMTNFAQGMAIRRGREINTYKVEIPRDADELLSDRSSSFLGRLIDKKTRESYVYNFTKNRMGRNPDIVTPGQEIVIINFEPEELIGIYKHFVAEQG